MVVLVVVVAVKVVLRGLNNCRAVGVFIKHARVDVDGFVITITMVPNDWMAKPKRHWYSSGEVAESVIGA